MKYDIEMGKQLIDELVELWIETKIKCDKIERLVKDINMNILLINNGK